MINTFIHQYNKNNKYGNILNNNMLNSGNQNKYHINRNFNIRINRQAIQNSSDKYIEEIKWGNGNNMAVAIGLNPSQALPANLDKTNELLVYLLYYNLNKYDGFYLMNLYSHIQTNGFKKGSHNDQIDIVVDAINTYSQTNNLTSIDVYIFFGKSFYINSKQLKALNSLNGVNVFTIGKPNHTHHHPGRGVNYKNIKATPHSYPLKLTNNHLI